MFRKLRGVCRGDYRVVFASLISRLSLSLSRARSLSVSLSLCLSLARARSLSLSLSLSLSRERERGRKVALACRRDPRRPSLSPRPPPVLPFVLNSSYGEAEMAN